VRVSSRFGDTYGAAYNLTVDLPGEPATETPEPLFDDGQSDEPQEDDETDDGLPVVPVGAGVAVVVLLVFLFRRSEDDENEPR
jgi:hypothetical protein